MISRRKTKAIAAVATLALASCPVTALAQGAPPTRSGEIPVPVEVAIEMANGELECRPPRLRLPARDLLELQVANGVDRAVTFVAPDFFKSTQHLDSTGFVYDVGQGGFLVAPNSTVRVKLRSPRPGEYSYSCYLPGQVPTPQSSGFLVVVPAAG